MPNLYNHASHTAASLAACAGGFWCVTCFAASKGLHTCRGQSVNSRGITDTYPRPIL